LVLSHPDFLRRQIREVLDEPEPNQRRSFWRRATRDW
jgi:hypothetical protein